MNPIHHPTTILFVDDDPLFLESVEYTYGDRFLCRTAKSPDLALDMLRAEEATRWDIGRFVAPHTGDSSPSGSRLFELRSSMLLDTAQSDTRFDIVSVVVVDFAMPSMSGVEFCRRIRELPAKKILLTGKTGDQTAVAAFNEQLIDVFLVKQDPEITPKLPREIERLAHSFFTDLFATFRSLTKNSDLAFLDEPVFEARFAALHREFAGVEYYLCSSPTRLLVVDAGGRTSSIVVYDEDAMRAQLETAEFMGAPEALLKRFRQRNAIAVFPTATGFYEPSYAASCLRYVHAAARLDGRARWWITVIRELEGDAANRPFGVSLAEHRRRRAVFLG